MLVLVLEAKGIQATKVKIDGRVVTYAVTVTDSEERDAMRILVANKLPKRRPTGLAEVYPAGSGGLIPTRSEEKAKFLMALQGEVERKLQRLPGIQSAHVTIVQPDKDIVRDLAVSLEKHPQIRSYSISSENFESIHSHNAYAQISRDKRRG